MRQLSVKEAWEVMGRPTKFDTSESLRNQTIKALGLSEDGHIVRAWAKQLVAFHNNAPAEIKYFHKNTLGWTSAQAHARCMHYGDWCLGILGLPKLKY